MVAGKAVTPQEVRDRQQLHDYWVHGEGLAKWAESPAPWTTLHKFLAKYIHDPDELDRTTSAWHYEVFKQHTGSDAYRAQHGGKIRGKKVGAG